MPVAYSTPVVPSITTIQQFQNSISEQLIDQQLAHDEELIDGRTFDLIDGRTKVHYPRSQYERNIVQSATNQSINHIQGNINDRLKRLQAMLDLLSGDIPKDDDLQHIPNDHELQPSHLSWTPISEILISKTCSFKVHKLELQGSEFPFIRSDCLLAGTSISRVLSLLRNLKIRKLMDPSLSDLQAIEYINQSRTWISHVKQKSRALSTLHDTCLLSSIVQHSDDHCDILNGSILDDRVPIQDGVDRAIVLMDCMRLTQTLDGVRLIYITQVDPTTNLSKGITLLILRKLISL